MPDTLSQLYKTSKQLSAENRDILGSVSSGQFSPIQSDEIKVSAPDVSGRRPSQIEDTSMYERFVPDPEMVLAYGDIDRMRAQGQSVFNQLGNMSARIIPDVLMGAVQNLADIADVEDYFNADDEVGNAVSSTMQDWIDSVNKAFPVYREHPGDTFDVGDSGWWVDNASNLINSAGSFALTGYITGGILGKLGDLMKIGKIAPNIANKISKIVSDESVAAEAAGAPMTEAQISKRVGELAGNHINKVNSWRDKGATFLNAIALNQAESIQEAMGVYKDVYSQKFADGDSEEIARQKAADAASLDVNINRVNILSNLTSAGLFTKANKAIVQAAGGLKNEILSETVQEGLEEGVNYIAQMEGMEQAKQGDNYKFDIGRALGHLKEPQGLESMFLGALGGGLQTGLTEILMSTKERASSAYENVKNSLKKTNPNSSDKADIAFSKIKDVNNYFLAKQNAKSQQEHDEIDANFVDNFGRKSYIDGSINTTIGELDRISNLNIDEEVKTSGLKPNEIQDVKDRAKKALNVLTSIKNAGDELDVNSFENPQEILDKKLELNKLNENKKSAENNLNNFQQNIKTRTPDISDSELENKSKLFLDKYNEAVLLENKASQELSELVSPEYQEFLNAKKIEKQQKIVDDANNKKASAIKATVVKPVEKKEKQKINTGTVNETSKTIPQTLDDSVNKLSMPDGKSVQEKFKIKNANEQNKIDDNDLVQLTGDKDTISIFSDDNGEMYMVSPGQSVQEIGTDTPSTILMLNRKIKDNKPNLMLAVRSAVDAISKNKRLNISISGVKFNHDEINAFMQSKGKIAEGKEYTPEDFFDFIKSRKGFGEEMGDTIEDNSVEPSDTIAEDIREPETDVNLSKISKDSEISSVNAKKSNPSSINYLAEKYKIVDGKYIGTGEVNQEYLLNSNPDKVYPGAEIIIEAYDGDPILTYDYDDKGFSIKKKDVSKSSSLHNATSAIRSNREIPIAIYLKQKDGSKGDLIGFLPETKWLNEGGVGSRKNINDGNVDATNSIVNDIDGLRNDITESFKSGNMIQVSSSISDVSGGFPLSSREAKSISESVPDIVNDVKSLGEKSPFGHVINGTVQRGQYPVSNISNEGILSRLPSGTPILLLPTQGNKLHAVPVRSKKIKDVLNGSKYIKNGILAHLGVLKTAQDKFNTFAMKNGRKLIDSADGLRDYLKSFIHMESADVFGNPNVSDRHAVILWEQSASGHSFIKYGITSSNGDVVDLNKLGIELKSTNATIKANANKKLDEIVGFIGEMRHNFQTDMLNKSDSFVGIEETFVKEPSPNYQSRYMNTLETNAKVAGKSDGKNIYTIQHVVGLDLGSNIKPEISKAIEESEETIIPKSEEAAPIVVKKKFEKRDVSDGGIDLIQSNIKPSIGIEQQKFDNPLSNINPEDSSKMGEEIIKHCK